jgi:Fe-S cluster biosynthesis and repair protein YggX
MAATLRLVAPHPRGNRKGMTMAGESRIDQFRQMAESDPENELGHFSLGKAYLDASRFAEAVGPLTRAIELNPRMSRAHALLGQALLHAGRKDQAVEALQRGLAVADELGDRMPREEMARLLQEQGVAAPPPPTTSRTTSRTTAEPSPAVAGTAGESGFRCRRCGRPDDRLPERPFKGPLGEKIHAGVCRNCWREWIGMGTKVVNELGLQLSNPQSQEIYDQYMVEFLQLEE